MIQRIQTLFLLQVIFLAFVLLFIPTAKVFDGGDITDVALLPLSSQKFSSTLWHYLAIVLNFLNLGLTAACVFLYSKRNVQRKLCLLVAVLWLLVTVIFVACPLVQLNDPNLTQSKNYYAMIIGLLAMLGAIIAARFIKKDIDLLKSADRIR